MSKKEKKPLTEQQMAQIISAGLTVMTEIFSEMRATGAVILPLNDAISCQFGIKDSPGDEEEFYEISVRRIAQENVTEIYTKEESDALHQGRQGEMDMRFMQDPVPDVQKILNEDKQ